MKKQCSITIPKIFCIENLIGNPYEFINRFKPDKWYKITQLILDRQLQRPINKNGKDWASISAKEFHKIAHNEYVQYLDFMKSEGLLEIDNHYILDEKTKYYRISDDIDLTHTEQVKIITEAKPFKDSQCKWSSQFIDDRLTISEEEMKRPLTGKRAYARSKFINGDHSFSKENKVNRHFTSITALSGETRRHILYHGKSVGEADTNSSHQFLIASLFKPQIYKNDLLNLREAFRLTRSDKWDTLYNDLKTFALCNKNNDDVILFTKLVVKGEFYDYFKTILKNMSEIDKKLHKRAYYFAHRSYPDYDDKKCVKQILFQILYDTRTLRSGIVFKAEFPTIFELCQLMHKRSCEITKTRKSSLPTILMRIESNLIIKLIAKQLIEYFRNKEFFFTVHDSVGTVSYLLPQLYHTIKSVYEQVTGLNVGVDTKGINEGEFQKHNMIFAKAMIGSISHSSDKINLLRSSICAEKNCGVVSCTPTQKFEWATML